MSGISFFSGFSSQGIDAVNRKMSAEDIARWKKIQEEAKAGIASKLATPNAQPIDLSNVKKLDMSLADVRKLSDEEVKKFQKIREQAYTHITNLDELASHPSQKIYAEVKVGDKTIATVYNNGTSMTSNAFGAKINDIITELDSKLSGPEGAQERAEAIAKAFGGEIVMADTAQTQTEYLATPPFIPKYEIDYEAMERDMQVAFGRMATPQTRTDTQTIALEGSDDAAGTSAKEEFLKFQEMSWEEKVRAMILKTMGLEEKDLEAMSAEEREKIEARIREKIEEEIEKKTGMSAGSSAGAAAAAVSGT